MNILVIGNGFDKAQGLDTCYTDFYNKYVNLKPESPLEERVKSEILSNYNTWADMEVAMGAYSAKWDNVDDFEKLLSY